MNIVSGKMSRGRKSQPQNLAAQVRSSSAMQRHDLVNKHTALLGKIAFALKNISADVEMIQRDLTSKGIIPPRPTSPLRPTSPTRPTSLPKINTALPAAAATQDSVLEKVNVAYQQFLRFEYFQLQHYPLPLLPAKVTEVEGDLFLDAPEEAALAHCIGEDALCTKGHADTLRRTLLKGLLPYLRSLGKKTGEVATLLVGEKYIFNLVTKPLTKGRRPYLHDFSSSVHELARLCTTLGIKKLAMPKIGAGLDRLPWAAAKRVIIEAFAGCPTEVQIFTRPDETRRDYADIVKSGLTVSAAPEETPSALEETSAAPEETSAAPEETPSALEETSAAPEETSAAPEEMPTALEVEPDAAPEAGPAGTPKLSAPTEKRAKRVSPTDRQMNDLMKHASREGTATRTESDARARSGDRLVQNKISTDLSNPKTLFPAAPHDDESEVSPDAPATPDPGRFGASKAEKATVEASAGGQTERSTDACLLTGALYPSAPSPTLPPSGEQNQFSPSATQLEIGIPAASPDVFRGYSLVAEILYDRARVESEKDADSEKDDENFFPTPGNTSPPDTSQSVVQEALRGKEGSHIILPTTQAEIDPAEDSTLVRKTKNLLPPKLKPNS